MNNIPLLSVVIATKNRETYCIETIKSIVELGSNEIQIAIADNSKSTQVKEFVSDFDNNAIEYRYNNSPMSSINNFNRAMELATGEYICLLGDDDGLLPNSLHILKWARSQNIDSICSNSPVTYYWPGAIDQFPKGGVIIPPFTNNALKVDTKKELDKLLRAGFQDYLLFSLPKSYHGFVKREIMLKIKNTTGHFYGGLSPDIYSAIALSILVKKHYVIDVPLTIAGACKKSSTAENFVGKHSGSLEDIPHLKNRKGYVWSNEVPKYYSTNTIWAETAIKAINEMNATNLMDRYNFYYLLAKGVINNYKFIPKILLKETLNFRGRKRINFFLFFCNLIYNTCKILIKKTTSIFENNKKGKFYTRKEVEDIHQCIEIAVDFINED